MRLNPDHSFIENPSIKRVVTLRSGLAKILATGLLLAPAGSYGEEKLINQAKNPGVTTPATPPQEITPSKDEPRKKDPGCAEDHIFDALKGEYRYTIRCV